MSNESIFFYYDPQRQGYDTLLWKTLTGSPAISGNNLRLNNASMLHYGDIYKGEITIEMVIPTAPTAGDIREFGFKQLNNGAKVTFKITDDVFSAETDNGDGITNSQTITWQDTWTNTATRFKIVWRGFEAVFYVNDVKVATDRTDAVAKNPLSVFISNSEADNMDIIHIQAKNIINYI